MQKTYAPCPDCRKINRVPIDSEKKPVCGSCKAELTVHDGVVEVTASGLTALIEKSPLPVVVDFWAPWCGPCRQFAPTFIQAAHDLAGEYVFAKIDTQEHQLASDTFRIRSIPTLVFFDAGFERARMSGALPLEPFKEWLGSQPRQRVA